MNGTPVADRDDCLQPSQGEKQREPGSGSFWFKLLLVLIFLVPSAYLQQRLRPSHPVPQSNRLDAIIGKWIKKFDAILP